MSYCQRRLGRIKFDRTVDKIDCDPPRGEVETSLEAAEDVDLSLGPDLLDAPLDSVHDSDPHVVLLRGGNHPLEEVFDLLMKPENTNIENK